MKTMMSVLLIIIIFLICNERCSHAVLVDLFGVTKAYELSVCKQRGCKDSGDYKNYFLIDDVCSKPIEGNSSRVIDFNANVLIYQSYNYNIRFMLNVTFESEQNDAGYQIKFYNGTTESCIRLRKNLNMMASGHKWFQLIIKDPDYIKRRNYTFYFGQVAVNGLKCLSKGDCREVRSNTQAVDVGIPSVNPNYDLDAVQRPATHCETKATRNSCLDIHHGEDRKRLILIHRMPKTVQQIYNQFGITRDFHPPIISYQSELLKSHVFKIIEDIDNDRTIYFTNYFTHANQTCKSDEYDEVVSDHRNGDTREVIAMKLSDDHIFVARCSKSSLSNLDFTRNRFLTLFQRQSTSTLGIDINNRMPKIRVLARNESNGVFSCKMKLRDRHALLQNQNFNITFEFRIYVSAQKSLVHHTITNPHQLITVTDLKAGRYLILLEPKVSSKYCSIGMCPFLKEEEDSSGVRSSSITCNACKTMRFILDLS